MLAIIVNTAKIFAKFQPLSEKYLMSVTDVKTYQNLATNHLFKRVDTSTPFLLMFGN